MAASTTRGRNHQVMMMMMMMMMMPMMPMVPWQAYLSTGCLYNHLASVCRSKMGAFPLSFPWCFHVTSFFSLSHSTKQWKSRWTCWFCWNWQETPCTRSKWSRLGTVEGWRGQAERCTAGLAGLELDRSRIGGWWYFNPAKDPTTGDGT